MALSKWFSFKNERDENKKAAPSTDKTPPAPAKAPPPSAVKPAQPAPAAPAPVPSAPPVPPPAPLDMKAITETFGAIQSALGDEKKHAPTITVPLAALLSALPEEFRGPAWKAGAWPAGELELDRSSTLSQLKKGKVVFPLSDFLPMLPGGWVSGQVPSSSLVPFDLAQIVAAMPPSLLLVKSDDKALAEVTGGPALFKPKAQSAPVASKPAPAAPAPAPVAPPAEVKPLPVAKPAPPPPAPEPVAEKPLPTAKPAPTPPPPAVERPVPAEKPMPVAKPAPTPVSAAPAAAARTAGEEKIQPGMSTVAARFDAIQ